MSDTKRAVFIVINGQRGAVTQEDYQREAEVQEVVFRQAGVETVAICQGMNDLRQQVGKAFINYSITVFFLTAADLANARKFKKEFPHVSVVVETGLIPDDEVAILDKGWCTNGTLRAIVGVPD